MLSGLGDREAPALLARRQHMHPAPLQHLVFGHILDMAVERHRVRDTEQPRVVDEALAPPAAPDDVEVQAGYPGPQSGDGVERVFDLLVRHQPTQQCDARLLRSR